MGLKDGFGFGDEPSGGGGADEKVKVTASDTTTNYLNNKIVAGTNVTLNTLNPGANEQIEINASGGAGADEKVKASATDTTTDFLGSKIVAGTNVTLNTLNPGANEQIEINATGGGGGNTIYSADDVVGANRQATLTDKLTWVDGSVIRTTNGVKIVEVAQETDFGTPVAGVITLTANTCYVVRGDVTLTNQLLINVQGISIIGNNRMVDKLSANMASPMLDIQSVGFTVMGLCFTNTNAGGYCIKALDYDMSTTDNNYQRVNIIEIANCQFRNCQGVWLIEGFELVDIINTVVWYIDGAGSIACDFRANRHLEITSCEFYNWFSENTNPRTGYSTLDSQIRFKKDLTSSVPVAGTRVGFGVVNISGSIIHPEITQNGLFIDNDSTTGFGTLSANTYTDTNLTPNTQVITMVVAGTSGAANVTINGQQFKCTFNTSTTQTASDFVSSHASKLLEMGIVCTSSTNDIILTASTPGLVLGASTWATLSGDVTAVIQNTTPPEGVLNAFNYSYEENYVIEANQGAVNGTAQGLMVISDNVIELNNSSVIGPPYDVQIGTAGFVGGAGPTNGITFPVQQRVVTSVANGSFRYNTKISANFSAVVTANLSVQSNGTFTVYLKIRKNGVVLFSIPQTHRNSAGVYQNKQATLTIAGVTEIGDEFDILVGIDSAQNVLVEDLFFTGNSL